MELGKTIKKNARGLGRLRWLHRQPHDRAVLAPGRLPARRGLHAGAGRHRRSSASASRWGRSAWATSPATTSAGHPQAPLPEKPDLTLHEVADLLCELGRFGQKTGAGWYDYKPGKRDAIPSPVVDKMIEDYRKELGDHAAQDQRRRDRHRLVYALVNEGAHILRGRHRQQALATSTWSTCTGYGFPLHRGGPMCYADSRACYNVVQAHEALRGATRTATRVLDSRRRCWPSSPPRARRFNLTTPAPHATDSKDISHDRSRHRLHRPHAARQELAGRVQHDPRRHARRPRGQGRDRARGDRPGRGRGRADGLRATPKAPPARTSRARSRSRRAAGHRLGRHRQPLLLLGPADHRDGGAAHHRGRGRRVSSPAAWSRSRACRTR